jgi:hypothetical protein
MQALVARVHRRWKPRRLVHARPLADVVEAWSLVG